MLSYDRPDIVLARDGDAILVVERTVEVPSGHNVGQRFARLAASAQHRIPTVYFGPYAAYKHGGATQGPRYMNLRLFKAIDAMNAIESASVIPIRWPVDASYEVLQTREKDARMCRYLDLFFRLYDEHGVPAMTSLIEGSEFAIEQVAERDEFIRREVANPEQYDVPPGSVQIAACRDLAPLRGVSHAYDLGTEAVLYEVGMQKLRSDPYTGMAILYAYLYCDGMAARTRPLILWFPHIEKSRWEESVDARPTRSRFGSTVRWPTASYSATDSRPATSWRLGTKRFFSKNRAVSWFMRFARLFDPSRVALATRTSPAASASSVAMIAKSTLLPAIVGDPTSMKSRPRGRRTRIASEIMPWRPLRNLTSTSLDCRRPPVNRLSSCLGSWPSHFRLRAPYSA